MIINPGELKFGIRAGLYPVITTEDSLTEYIKDKEGTHRIELAYPLLPISDTLGPRIIDIEIEAEQVRPVFDKVKINKGLEQRLKNRIKEKKAKEKEKKK